ncbi:MAG: M28 family peptidase, partial [Flavobacteriales bacterium]|nr:M28 family peptidase [Flavobacteriales bacterium]
AHYDHLGWGGSNSLHAGDSAIHNGADDNASGVGALLLLAERLEHKNTSNNYLFMAFSGEENGLWGSNHFCDNPTIDLEAVNYMLNMDMVGRLNDERTLAIYGVGTSPYWMDQLNNLQVDSITISTEESGVGPSDHTSFYLEDLPVLHFFTRQHKDYHKPTDDVDKIRYDGIVSVVNYIETLITWLDDDPKITFTKTKEEKSETPAFKVTLGVMPDYLFSGEGMRIDGVNEGRPADNAGLLEGDIVVAMGEDSVSDMQSYMECLGKFEPGDTTLVQVLRGDSLETKPVVWD